MKKRGNKKNNLWIIGIVVLIIVIVGGILVFKNINNEKVKLSPPGPNLVLTDVVYFEDINWIFSNPSLTVQWYAPIISETDGDGANSADDNGYGFKLWLYETGTPRYKTNSLSTLIYPGENVFFNTYFQKTNRDEKSNVSVELIDSSTKEVLFRVSADCNMNPLNGVGGKTIVYGKKNGRFTKLYDSSSSMRGMNQPCYKNYDQLTTNFNVVHVTENGVSHVYIRNLYMGNGNVLNKNDFALDGFNDKALILNFSVYSKTTNNYFYLKNFSIEVVDPSIHSRPYPEGDMIYIDSNGYIDSLNFNIINNGNVPLTGSGDVNVKADIIDNVDNGKVIRSFEGNLLSSDLGIKRIIPIKLDYIGNPADRETLLPYDLDGKLYSLKVQIDKTNAYSETNEEDNVKILPLCVGDSKCYRPLNNIVSCEDSDRNDNAFTQGAITFTYKDGTTKEVAKDYCDSDGFLVEYSCYGYTDFVPKEGYYQRTIDCLDYDKHRGFCNAETGACDRD